MNILYLISLREEVMKHYMKHKTFAHALSDSNSQPREPGSQSELTDLSHQFDTDFANLAFASIGLQVTLHALSLVMPLHNTFLCTCHWSYHYKISSCSLLYSTVYTRIHHCTLMLLRYPVPVQQCAIVTSHPTRYVTARPVASRRSQ
jgi:hypothetical protein